MFTITYQWQQCLARQKVIESMCEMKWLANHGGMQEGRPKHKWAQSTRFVNTCC